MPSKRKPVDNKVWTGLVSARPNDRQNEEEDVDDVQVEVEGSEDVFLGGQAVLVLPS